jgi:hypothetical protein
METWAKSMKLLAKAQFHQIEYVEKVTYVDLANKMAYVGKNFHDVTHGHSESENFVI